MVWINFNIQLITSGVILSCRANLHFFPPILMTFIVIIRELSLQQHCTRLSCWETLWSPSWVDYNSLFFNFHFFIYSSPFFWIGNADLNYICSKWGADMITIFSNICRFQYVSVISYQFLRYRKQYEPIKSVIIGPIVPIWLILPILMTNIADIDIKIYWPILILRF